jgi:hypothetical protein
VRKLTAPRLAACCAVLLWALAACSGSPSPAPPAPAATSSATAVPTASGTAGPAHPTGCRLPAPLKSDDACSTDADCGVSEPCHARACVARARSHPPTPDTMCTQMLQCGTADANRCGCLEGRCALIPPS